LSEIQAFIASLNASQKEKILTDLYFMGRGSLDFAKNLIGAASNPPPPPDPAAPQWCTCRRCRPMETDVENVCCKRVNCITQLNTFSNICLDRDILEVCIKARCDFRADEFDFTMESFRKAGYRQYIMWRFGKLGRGNRRVVPSCVVLAIRDSFPSANGQYMGYRSKLAYRIKNFQPWLCGSRKHPTPQPHVWFF